MMHSNVFFNSRRPPAAGLRTGAIVLFMTFAVIAGFGGGKQESMALASAPVPEEGMAAPMKGTETAVLAGGCFWGVEAVFERLDGVLDVVSGYSGGEAGTANYRAVGTGTTGHAESVRIIFDPELIAFDVLLEVFFNVAHDPTQLNYQGPDIGSEYRSAVFFASDEQQQITDRFIKKLDVEGTFKKPIVTRVVPLEAFYPAEDYHQDFMRLNPRHPYIVYWDVPKVAHLEKAYPELLTEQ